MNNIFYNDPLRTNAGLSNTPWSAQNSGPAAGVPEGTCVQIKSDSYVLISSISPASDMRLKQNVRSKINELFNIINFFPIPLFAIALVLLLAAAPWRVEASLNESAGNDMGPDEEQATTLYYNGQHERALMCIERSLSEHPKSLNLLMIKGHVLRQMGESESARNAYQEALRISAGNPAASYYLALCNYLTAKPYNALNVVEHILKNEKRPAFIEKEALFLKGMIEFESGRFKEAKATFAEADKNFPHNWRLLQMLGRSSEACGDISTAHSAYIDALACDPSALEFLAQAAPLIRKTGDVANSFKFYYHLLRIRDDETIKKAFRQIEQQFDKIRSSQAASQKSLEPVKAGYPCAGFKKGAEISVGLSTKSDGSPVEIKSVKIKSSGKFMITGKKNDILFTGKAGVLYELTLSSGSFSIKNTDSQKISRIGGGTGTAGAKKIILKNADSSDTVLFRGIRVGSGSTWENSEARYYRGAFDIVQFPGGKNFHIVNRLGLEEYLLSVVPSEMPAEYHHSALEAQSVCCRSEALYKKTYMKRHEKYGYDICDDQHCQMYRGVSWETPVSSSAVSKTSGLVLKHSGKICDAIYSDNCGGFTQASADISGWGNFAYLSSAPDVSGRRARISRMVSPAFMEEFLLNDSIASCREGGTVKSYESRWVRIIDSATVQKSLGNLGVGKVLRIIPRQRAFAGHLDAVEIIGTKGRKVVRKELDIRRMFAYSPLRSSKFVVETVYDANGEPRAFWFLGAGFGHGVGMCQNGADGRARDGDDFREILAHYFSGARLSAFQ